MVVFYFWFHFGHKKIPSSDELEMDEISQQEQS